MSRKLKRFKGAKTGEKSRLIEQKGISLYTLSSAELSTLSTDAIEGKGLSQFRHKHGFDSDDLGYEASYDGYTSVGDTEDEAIDKPCGETLRQGIRRRVEFQEISRTILKGIKYLHSIESLQEFLLGESWKGLWVNLRGVTVLPCTS